MEIIDRLKVYLNATGLSVQDCASLIGVSFPTLYRLINGSSDKSAVLKIDKFLDGQDFYPSHKQDRASAKQEEQ